MQVEKLSRYDGELCYVVFFFVNSSMYLLLSSLVRIFLCMCNGKQGLYNISARTTLKSGVVIRQAAKRRTNCV
jgi:hypothetical protein